MRWLPLVVLLCMLPAHRTVTITEVHPTRGSTAGGTRLHIRGTGFSTNTGGSGNVVKIGPYLCFPIPLHCTEHQVACKTEPMKGLVGWSGWSSSYPITVTVDGKESEPYTGFSYHFGWFHTPRIYDVAPRTVTEGTIISVDGRFHPTPFDFDELRAPSREIPLASVKVANRATEKQRPENEPFGKSGTRCGLFDPDIEVSSWLMSLSLYSRAVA
jgi:hypothetical protein